MPFSSAPHVRRVWAVIAVVAVAVVAVGGVFLALRSPNTPNVVAIVNQDTGEVGERVAVTLAASEEHEWQIVDSTPAVTADHLAVVTIPADFTDRVTALGGPDPQQAEVTIERGPDADDAQVAALSTSVSEVTSAAGIRDLLTGVASARSQLQQATLPAQILTSATAAADKQVQQVLGGVDDVLPLLQTANDGANQLVDVANQVSGMVDGARGPVAEASTRLSELGVTIGDVTTGAENLRRGLTATTDTLRAAGVDTAELDRTSADLTALTAQLSQLTALLGTEVGEATEIGAVLDSGFRQVEGMSAQLSSAGSQLQAGIGPIAAQAPDLVATASDQIVSAVDQLKTVSAAVSTQLGEGIGAIPLKGGVAAVSSTLASPVSVVQLGDSASGSPLDAQTLVIVFAATTVALAAAVGWLLVGRPVRHSEA
ncbi:YhgE/Pip domain-containing protein [Rhodococcus triatomae]|nr:hypothetical protein G419_20225 [Rhodococcus triatomae BKS 15-14]